MKLSALVLKISYGYFVFTKTAGGGGGGGGHIDKTLTNCSGETAENLQAELSRSTADLTKLSGRQEWQNTKRECIQ